jgi:hypothetical protein
MGFLDDVRSTLRRQGAPVTLGINVVLVAVSVISFLTQDRLAAFLTFAPDWVVRPWTWITYPFIFLLSGIGVLFLICTVMWLSWVGGSTERDLGSGRYAALWAAFTVIPALFIVIAWHIAGVALPVYGPWLPLSAVTVIWGFRNRATPVLLFGIVPLTGYWLALLSVAIVFFDYGRPAPLIGVFACLPLFLAYAFATNRIPGLSYSAPVAKPRPSRAQREKEDRFFDDVRKRELERSEREKLRKLFERSFDEEDQK